MNEPNLRWTLKASDILDEPADVLICSANPYLRLSGGVGAELRRRYGSALQDALQAAVAQRTPRVIGQGEVISCSVPGMPWRAVLHAVALDVWYDSSAQVIERTVATALGMAADVKARRVVLVALATGYGHLSLADFAAGIRPLMGRKWPPVEEVCICLPRQERLCELAQNLLAAAVMPAELRREPSAAD